VVDQKGRCQVLVDQKGGQGFLPDQKGRGQGFQVDQKWPCRGFWCSWFTRIMGRGRWRERNFVSVDGFPCMG
jgi:hypothetical protein